MKLSVIVPVYNEENTVRQLLKSVEAVQLQDGVEKEIIVIDDGSSDGTSQAIRDRFPNVYVLQGDGSLWWAGATNLGIRHALQRSALAPYILMLNDDVEFDSTYLAQMQRGAVTHPGCLIGTLAVYSEDPNRVFWCGQAASRRQCRYGYVRRDRLSGCVPAKTLPGRGMLVPTEVFHRIGLLDEKTFPQYAADFDFSLRARKAGYPLLCCCDTVLAARASQTGPGSLHRRDRIGIFLRSFWNIRSPNYFPTLWRFGMKHYGFLGPFWFAHHMSKVLMGDLLRRTGLRGGRLQRSEG